jgi:hypothetical protein
MRVSVHEDKFKKRSSAELNVADRLFKIRICGAAWLGMQGLFFRR